MKKFIILLLAFFPLLTHAQIGIKAGLNFANVTKADDINSSSRTGYHAGIFLAGSFKSIIGSRTELLYSRQGYDFSTNMNTGKVNLDYILLPQFIAINITPIVQLQAGGQVAYLLNAEVDSTSSTGNSSADKIIDLVNRFDFGLGGGVEVHPVKMIVAGVRLNLSLGRLFKEPEPGEQYSFIPDLDAKNNLFQIYAGMRFGAD